MTNKITSIIRIHIWREGERNRETETERQRQTERERGDDDEKVEHRGRSL